MVEQTAGSLGSPRPIPAARVRFGRAGSAGAIAALAMLALQLLWRLEWSAAGVPSFPEVIVAAVARLTPLSIFGAATENYGSLAKQTLFVGVLIATVATGYNAGEAAARLASRFGSGFAARLLAGALIAGGILLAVLVAIMPVAHLGMFAVDSGSTGAILIQHIVSFALFALAWAVLTTAQPATVPTAGAGLGRRGLLIQGIGLVSVAAVGGLTWRLIRPRTTVDSAVSERAAEEIAARARASRARAASAPTSAALPPPNQIVAAAPAGSTNAGTALAPALFAQLDADGRLTPELTATSDFYHVSKNISDPRVDVGGWSLKINGMVDNPLEIGYDDLVARATTQKITTLCCISNEINGNLISTAEWSGVPLKDVLTEAGVQRGAVDLKFRCADDYEDSIPVERGMDRDTIIVVGMNGQPLPDDHGFPARLIIPGIYGMKNVKWVEEIEAVDHDFLGYWQTRGWSDPAPNQIWARVDTPESGEKTDQGEAVAAGVASAGDKGISRVEVSLDDGETWADAILEPALNPPFTWVRWAFPFTATVGEHKLVVRATDGEGTVADEKERPPLPDGATGWSRRTVKVEA